MSLSTNFHAPGIGASFLVSALGIPLVARCVPTMTELRYRGRRSGRPIALPVAYARVGDLAVVRVARSETKTWWRNFAAPHPVSIRLRGRWADGVAHVAYPGSLEHEELAAYYQQTFTRCAVPVDDPLVVIELPRRRRGPRESGHGGRRARSGGAG